jgi:hypothetical protein
MSSERWVTACRVIQDADIGEKNGIGSSLGGVVDRLMPRSFVSGARKSVNGDQNFAAMGMSISNALNHFILIEIEAGIVAGIGTIAKAAINGIGSGFDRSTQRGRRAGRTYEFEIRRSHLATASVLFGEPQIRQGAL